MDPADVLEQAADLVETVGWTQGSYLRTDHGDGTAVGYCTMGACRQVLRIPEDDIVMGFRTPAYVAAIHALIKQVNDPNIIGWNDTPDRTRDEVIEALRLAAKDLRNEASV